MILQLLFQRLVAQHEPEPSLRSHIDGLLQIQFVETNHVLDRFRATLFKHREMNLAVHEAIIGHVIHRAVFQIEQELNPQPTPNPKNGPPKKKG